MNPVKTVQSGKMYKVLFWPKVSPKFTIGVQLPQKCSRKTPPTQDFAINSMIVPVVKTDTTSTTIMKCRSSNTHSTKINSVIQKRIRHIPPV